MKILILLPYYNRPNLVLNPLRSILQSNKHHSNWQLAAIDDGSDEGKRLAPILSEWFGRTWDDNIKLYEVDTPEAKRERGQSIHGVGLNQAIRESDADICILLNDDDALEETYLYRLSKWFEDHPDEVGCYSAAVGFNPEKEDPLQILAKRGKPFSSEELYTWNCPRGVGERCLLANKADACQAAWKRSVHEEHHIWFPEELTYAMDHALFTQLDRLGPFPYTGLLGQYKAEHPYRLTHRGNRRGAFDHVDTAIYQGESQSEG